ncbi:hypothetical protein V8G54_027485 [Vigna mungo]|uniref:Uncharacterized protein n=1 Tax=Vigna mungo TaxID=3915 RepID=A0AAQ3N2Y0_VIGMU
MLHSWCQGIAWSFGGMIFVLSTAMMVSQFLNLFGDVQSIKRAEDMHAKLFLPHRSMSELKKRHAEDFLSSTKLKRQELILLNHQPNPGNSGLLATSSRYDPDCVFRNECGHASYGAYAGYGGNYANSQLPATVPPCTAYGAYPLSYS